MCLFTILIKDSEHPKQQVRYDIEASDANTALQVAAARSRTSAEKLKSIEEPTDGRN
jgi:hypothetical protein